MTLFHFSVACSVCRLRDIQTQYFSLILVCTPQPQDPGASTWPSSTQNLLDLLDAPEEKAPADLEKLMEGLESELASMHALLANQGDKGPQVMHRGGSNRAAMDDPYSVLKGNSSALNVIYEVITAQPKLRVVLIGVRRFAFRTVQGAYCRR